MLRVIFGGTFDPIHNGHVQTSLAAFRLLKADHMQVMPSAQPPHRDYPGATPEQRLAMVRLAYAAHADIVAENWELERERPSYSLLTLQEMRATWPQDQLIFLLGNDAFAKLDSWHGWQQLLDVAHLAVMQRPHETSSWSEGVRQLAARHQVDNVQELHDRPAGCMICLPTPEIEVSATLLRDRIAASGAWEQFVPEAVAAYIKQQQLYQTD
ncbi:nicotinate-nucleotide adenylyltransferase [Pseudidiomarina sp. 1APP75-32.1]|uniref:Probable nicotinate-nucleotide adenylyltransferase n=1 Tax=Pseudidiomarina terrestris TaxID=2820060 RepID=A0AAW7QV76_9GAMM|nr:MULTISPECIES: nicotinate-nucleotide adenylyltransferase [unclassified Pseudidiomarina]MDN7123342.1 nicotinate-nucleotide adenylyltransferase [Pseudidiomarina sp. 1APP75-32.1]MDN7128933.1 nicotinate-nucleotide adenylyltransferase [Pseudidiomarina sp. 1APR75-15]